MRRADGLAAVGTCGSVSGLVPSQALVRGVMTSASADSGTIRSSTHPSPLNAIVSLGFEIGPFPRPDVDAAAIHPGPAAAQQSSLFGLCRRERLHAASTRHHPGRCPMVSSSLPGSPPHDASPGTPDVESKTTGAPQLPVETRPRPPGVQGTLSVPAARPVTCPSWDAITCGIWA
jgi:hypothetical protein